MIPYHVFLRESALSLDPDLAAHLEAYEDEDAFLLEAGKEGVYKENYFLRKELQTKYIRGPLGKSINQERIVELVANFIDTHHKALSTSGPVYSFRFAEPEVMPLYQMFSVNAEQMVQLYNQMVAETYENGTISPFFTSWVKFAPHKVLITSILMEAVQSKYPDIIKACELMWAFTEYPIIYADFWKTGVKEDVMNYTIEHLGSKYRVTKVSNILQLLEYDAHVATESCMDALRAGQDNTYSDVMQRYRNQFKSKLKNIAIAYYKNSEDNASLHQMVSEFDDGSKADQEGHNSNISQTIDRTVAKFNENGPNSEIIRICADGSKVDRSNLSGYIAQIYAAKNNRIPKMVEDIISSYFAAFPSSTSLVNSEFVGYGLTLYRSLSNSKNTTNAEMREILDSWLDIIDIRSHYNREATIINYTRAIFNYFVLLINYYN